MNTAGDRDSDDTSDTSITGSRGVFSSVIDWSLLLCLTGEMALGSSVTGIANCDPLADNDRTVSDVSFWSFRIPSGLFVVSSACPPDKEDIWRAEL